MKAIRIVANDVAKKYCELEMELCCKMMEKHRYDENDGKFKQWALRYCDAAKKDLKLTFEHITLVEEGEIADFFIAGMIEGAIGSAIIWTPVIAGCKILANKIGK